MLGIFVYCRLVNLVDSEQSRFVWSKGLFELKSENIGLLREITDFNCLYISQKI